MKYDIGATETQLTKLHDAIRLGLGLNEALLYADIDKYIYAEIYNSYLLFLYISSKKQETDELNEIIENTNLSVVGVGINTLSPSQEDQFKKKMTLYSKDKEFKRYVIDCYNIVRQLERDKVMLELKLINDIHKAQDKHNNNYCASTWLLERLFPEKYGKDTKGQETIKQLKPISVEFISSDKKDEQRVADMEALVDKELNGESKA